MKTASARKVLPRRRVATGPRRPQYLHAAELDRVMMIVTALAAEVSALRDRLDTHESLAERGVVATRDAVENFVAADDDTTRREANRMAMLRRVYRILTEELDAIDHAADPSAAAHWKMPDEWDKT